MGTEEFEIAIEVEREEDGRYIAEVPAIPGVMAYGATEDEAVRRALTLALQVMADWEQLPD
jgi:predicted RNase H-like HicB family nuclease